MEKMKIKSTYNNGTVTLQPYLNKEGQEIVAPIEIEFNNPLDVARSVQSGNQLLLRDIEWPDYDFIQLTFKM